MKFGKFKFPELEHQMRENENNSVKVQMEVTKCIIGD